MPKITTNAYFDEIEFHLTQELLKARESLKICVAWIRWEKYTPIFDQLAQRGVSVEVIYNHDLINRANFVSPSQGVKLFPVQARGYRALMHNKFCIVDNATLITGSFNWSKLAGTHFENIIVVKDDFPLIKKYLFEYHDLINYYNGYHLQKRIQCLHIHSNNCQCRYRSFNLGILGDESGKYDESLIKVWSVCFSAEHATFVLDSDEQYLLTHLGLKYSPEWDEDDKYDKETMLIQFVQEMEQIKSIQQYFSERAGNPVHAIGIVEMSNESEHLKYDDPPEYIIKIIWRDMYYRKAIPEVLYDDGYGFINEIISKHI